MVGSATRAHGILLALHGVGVHVPGGMLLAAGAVHAMHVSKQGLVHRRIKQCYQTVMVTALPCVLMHEEEHPSKPQPLTKVTFDLAPKTSPMHEAPI